MFKKKSTAIATGASAPPGVQPVPAAPVGNPAVAKHVKKQHVKHNKGMQATPIMGGTAPAGAVPAMPNPYTSQR